MNINFMDTQKMNDVYDDCAKQGFHPGRGNRTGIEAVTAHELGHRITGAAAVRMGLGNDHAALHEAANRIVQEAVGNTAYRGTVALASDISKYATTNSAETIAEAVADVYCNGNNARTASQAVVRVLNSYLK